MKAPMWAVFKWGQLVRGPYKSRDEAIAQAFEIGAMPVNPAYEVATRTGATTPVPVPLYTESQMFQGYEIRQANSR